MGFLRIDLSVDAQEDRSALLNAQLLFWVRFRKRALELDCVFFIQLVEGRRKAPDTSPRMDVERRWAGVGATQGLNIARLLLGEEVLDERGGNFFFRDQRGPERSAFFNADGELGLPLVSVG